MCAEAATKRWAPLARDAPVTQPGPTPRGFQVLADVTRLR